MKKIFTFSLAIILVSAFALAGFGCESEPSSPTPGLEIGSETTLKEIIGSADRADEISYDMHITGPDGTKVVSVVYVDGTKMRQESEIEGRKMIVLGDSTASMYAYYPDENSAMKIDMSDSEFADQVEDDPYAMLEDVVGSVKVVGYETIDGKKTVIVEYTLDETESDVTTKMWIWEKHGIPIKVVTTNAGYGTTTVEFRNIEIGNIDDSLFELPAGVNVVDLESMFQGGFDPSMLEGLVQ